MRKFVISDIHGNGNLYFFVMSYLENISKYEEVILYINGDLIDRGNESAEILLDVYNRVNDKNNPLKIVYLGGNHELLMYQIFNKRRKGIPVFSFNNWYLNGGEVTDKGLNNINIEDVIDFIGNLKLYHVFDEKIDNKNILLVHACSPINVRDNCELKIKDNNLTVNHLVWSRKDDFIIPLRIGNKNYFTIVGHTANNNKYGYVYHKDENYLNIDGGSAMYVSGLNQYNHFPLVEIKDDYLRILTFNSDNEIIYGNYFKNNQSISFNNDELLEERNVIIKKLNNLDYKR